MHAAAVAAAAATQPALARARRLARRAGVGWAHQLAGAAQGLTRGGHRGEAVGEAVQDARVLGADVLVVAAVARRREAAERDPGGDQRGGIGHAAHAALALVGGQLEQAGRGAQPRNGLHQLARGRLVKHLVVDLRGEEGRGQGQGVPGWVGGPGRVRKSGAEGLQHLARQRTCVAAAAATAAAEAAHQPPPTPTLSQPPRSPGRLRSSPPRWWPPR